jgi:DNA-binding HxlR family transcriptional regulator
MLSARKNPRPDSANRASHKRTYAQFCGIAKALDVIGERWTLLILRDLLLGPRRYGDLLENLPGITTNLLALRLKSLKAAGVIERREQPRPARGEAYELTSAGQDLEPVLLAMGRWGWRFMQRPSKGDRVYLGWALIALKRRYRGVDHPLTIELADGPLRFQMRLTPDYADIREGAPWIAEVTALAATDGFRALFHGGASAAALAAGGFLSVQGDAEGWKRFLGAFDLAA